MMSGKIKNKHSLKRREIKDFFYDLKSRFTFDLDDFDFKVESGFFDNIKIIFIDDVPCFMYIDDAIFFTVMGILKFKPKDKFVVVDMGAVQFITSGADVMSPGVVDADLNIEKDDQVWICDVRNKKPLAVGYALMNGSDMIKENKGKSVKIIHYVGDKYWNISKI